MTKHFLALSVGSLFVVLVFAGSPDVGAAELGTPASHTPTTQQSFQSRIDQLAQPAARQTSGRPDEPNSSKGASPGSFPRSFLIPGTDTSIRVGGSVDATIGYHTR
jgi:hypothetical protein